MRERIRSAAFIARTDLSFMLRQRETILWVFVMPLLFFYFIGTVTGGFGGGSPDRPDPIALQTPSSGVALDAIVKRLEAGNFRVERPATAEALQPFTRRLVIPAFTAESLSAGTQVQATFEQRGDGMTADLDQFRVSRAVYTVVADLAALKAAGQPVTRESLAALTAAPRQLTLSVAPA